MIRYALRCADGHEFESWFRSSAAFDELASSGLLSCAVCGGAKVEKALMAPSLGAAAVGGPAPGAADAPAPAAPAAPPPSLREPSSPLEAAIRALRARVEANAENVGGRFAREARAIHEGEAESRAIYGEATGEEVKDLLEDGIEIAPLPWGSRRDA